MVATAKIDIEHPREATTQDRIYNFSIVYLAMNDTHARRKSAQLQRLNFLLQRCPTTLQTPGRLPHCVAIGFNLGLH